MAARAGAENDSTGNRAPRNPLSPWLVSAGASAGVALVLVGAVGCRPGSGSAGSPAAGSAGHRTVEIPTRQPVSPAERERYLGSAACAGCHRREARQQRSRHAHTLARVDPQVHAPLFRRPSRLSDPLEELTFTTTVRDDRCLLRASDGSRTHEAAADYAFGSGAVAYTYVGRVNDTTTELRLSHYVRGNRWDFTPGQRVGSSSNAPAGQVLKPAEEQACFLCHSTALVRNGERLDLERSILGVGCETCHGPGSEHVAAVRRGDLDRRMARLSTLGSRISIDLCGQCHRAPGSVDLNDAGMASQLPRLQSVALSFSACFQKGGASCVTCHDPHGNAGEVTRAAYNGKCVSCHNPAVQAQVACPVQPAGDCVSCHMPAQDVGMPSAPRFRNHWIKVWSGAAAAGARNRAGE